MRGDTAGAGRVPLHPGAAPGDAGYLAELGRLACSVGQGPQALHFERALELEPWNPRLHANRAVALAELGRIDDAVLAAEQAVHLNPEGADLWEMLAGASSEAGQGARAKEAAARAELLRRRRPSPVAHGGIM